jgi:hypothetical protein
MDQEQRINVSADDSPKQTFPPTCFLAFAGTVITGAIIRRQLTFNAFDCLNYESNGSIMNDPRFSRDIFPPLSGR